MSEMQKRQNRMAQSASLKRSAERRRCPQCGRGGGLGSLMWNADTRTSARICRYCGFVRKIED